MVRFVKLYRSQQQLFIIRSSRFHIQGLFEICCSRVKVSVSWVSYHLTSAFVCALSLSEGPLASIRLLGLEVNATDLCADTYLYQ